MEKVIYIETTIPSFYTETRQDEESRVLRKWTRQWWHLPKEGMRLVTSSVVVNELSEMPREERRRDSLDLIKSLERMAYISEVADLANLYIENKIMPATSGGDADHLALATWHGCDMLLTWNCRHLANPNKMKHIRLINARMDLATPLLVTPLELLGPV